MIEYKFRKVSKIGCYEENVESGIVTNAGSQYGNWFSSTDNQCDTILKNGDEGSNETGK